MNILGHCSKSKKAMLTALAVKQTKLWAKKFTFNVHILDQAFVSVRERLLAETVTIGHFKKQKSVGRHSTEILLKETSVRSCKIYKKKLALPAQEHRTDGKKIISSVHKRTKLNQLSM